MNRLDFSIRINASKEKVWKTLLEDETYLQWTSVFCEGSYAKTDWTEGSTAFFMNTEGNGMVSRITVHRPNDYLEIQHVGVIERGQENRDIAQSQGWRERWKHTG